MELPYDSIGFGAGTLAISFKAGGIAALEKSFRDAGQNNLEVIKQCDAEGHVQELLGHTKIETTRIYCTVTKEQVRTSHRRYMAA